jgi:Holliday junction resolvase RusA-like endonuclease
MPIPKGTSKKKIIEMTENLTIHHTKKPDIDNLVKFSMDCLNGIAWEDDKQVISLSSYKYYSLKPRTEIIIEEPKQHK